jgi:hypothetical protein
MRFVFCIALTCAIGGCADTYLDKQEDAVFAVSRISPKSTLEDQGRFAGELSDAYMRAGRSTANAQDVASFVVFLGAATAVSGAVGTASDAEVAKRAIAAATVENAGKRTVPKSAIQAIYTGAKRLNCVGTMSAVGVQLLAEEDDRTKLAARAITYGAIREVMITTRDGLTREIADYTALVTDISDAAKTTAGIGLESATGGQPLDEAAINKYLKLIANCLGQLGSQKDAEIKQ